MGDEKLVMMINIWKKMIDKLVNKLSWRNIWLLMIVSLIVTLLSWISGVILADLTTGPPSDYFTEEQVVFFHNHLEDMPFFHNSASLILNITIWLSIILSFPPLLFLYGDFKKKEYVTSITCT